MNFHPNKVLLIYTDKYYLVKQIYPFGLDIIADYLRKSGYRVSIEYPFLVGEDVEKNLLDILQRHEPDVIGLGLRNLDTTMACEQFGNYAGSEFNAFFLLPDANRIVETIRKYRPDIPIIAGGGAFNISPVSILQALGIDYGVVGEGEEPFRRFLEAFPDREKLSDIPNLVFKTGSSYRINPRQTYSFSDRNPAWNRDGKFRYAFEAAGMPVQVKRGCNQGCSYCVEPLIEGPCFSFRDPEQVIAELKSITETHDGVRSIFFVDTEFNVPDTGYASLLIKSITASGLHQYFRFSSQFIPAPFDDDFAQLLSEAGFSVILTCSSFSDSVLSMNRTSYREKDALRTIKLCETHGLDCTVNLIFGLPGETRETVDHTLDVMMTYGETPFRRYEYTVGARIYNGTPLCRWIEAGNAGKDTFGEKTNGYLEPFFYCSPSSPMALKAYIDSILPSPMEFRNRIDSRMHQYLSVAYLTDQGLWQEAAARFINCDISAQTAIYDYLFKKLTENHQVEAAKKISEQLLRNLFQIEVPNPYTDQIPIIQHYLTLLNLYS